MTQIADQERFEGAIAAIDAANADDPHVLLIDGTERPKELAHAEPVSEWVGRSRPDAPEQLLLAVHEHHIPPPGDTASVLQPAAAALAHLPRPVLQVEPDAIDLTLIEHVRMRDDVPRSLEFVQPASHPILIGEQVLEVLPVALDNAA